MEQQCKIGGEGLRNRGVLNEDRISELPEALLLHILSSLPSETVIATSVLSKRWRSLWKMMPNLKFDSAYHRTFSENVSRSLVLHQAPVLESLSLTVRYKCDASEMGLWIGNAFTRDVRKLVVKFKLDFKEEYADPVNFPGVLCRCNNTLESLKLDGSILLDLPSPVCFNSLRVLKLYHVYIQGEESVSNLLCGCPSLQDLVMHRRYTNVENFTIAVPSLQRLTLEDEYYAEGCGGYVINAPSLKYLNIKGFNGFECCLIENAPELLEAKITEVSNITNENILESVTSAKRLSLYLSPSEIKYPTGKIFYQLVYLDLHTDKREWCNLLSLMLDSSPKLQFLKLIDPYRYCGKGRPIDCWNQPKCVPECLLFHLETFVWTRYDWQREDEKEVATYILNNARRLKKATLSTKPIESKDLEKLEKRREMLDEFANVVKASSSCHLVLEADTYSKN